MVKRALEGLPGINHADVSFTTKQAIVWYEQDKVNVTQMIDAIKQAGFSAQLHE